MDTNREYFDGIDPNEDFYRSIDMESILEESRLQEEWEQEELTGYMSLTDDEIAWLREHDHLNDESYQSRYGFSPSKEAASTHKDEFTRVEAATAEALRNGADREGVDEVIDTNALNYKDYLDAQKMKAISPDMGDAVKDIETRTLNSMQRLRMHLENLNDRRTVLTKTLARELTAPDRKRTIKHLREKAHKKEQMLRTLKEKQRKMTEKIDKKAQKRMNKERAYALKNGYPMPPSDFTKYRTDMEQMKLNIIEENIKSAKDSSIRVYAMIDRRLAKEAAKDAAIETYRERIKMRVDELKQAARPNQMQSKKEFQRTNEELDEDGPSFKDIVQNVDARHAEEKANRAADQMERDMDNGDLKTLESTDAKLRMYKLDNEVTYERWNEKGHRYEDISKSEAVAMLAKDSKLIPKKYDEIQKNKSFSSREAER